MMSIQMASNTHKGQMLVILLCVFASTVAGLTQALCSNENTASSSGQSYMYQSNGHCETSCQGYAFGIVQDLFCWCSNYAPVDTVPVTNCNEQCPGYPYENCGSNSSGLYGYIALGPSASGTISGSSQPTSMEASSSSSFVSVLTESVFGSQTVLETVTIDPTVASTFSSVTSTTGHVSSSQTGSSTITPIVSVQTFTQSGTVMTQTVTTMPTSAGELTQTKKSSSPGLIAGITIACIAAVAFFLIGAFFYWRNRKRQQSLFVDAEGNLTTSGLGSPKRPMSVSTSSALMATASGSVPPRINLPLDGDESSPVSPVDRRGSHGGIYPYYHEQDSRLMPFNTHYNNDSRSSFNDGNDYSRRLEVKNPDPYETDSRSMQE